MVCCMPLPRQATLFTQGHNQPLRSRPSGPQCRQGGLHCGSALRGVANQGAGQGQQLQRFSFIDDQGVGASTHRAARWLPRRGVQHRRHTVRVGYGKRSVHSGQRGFKLAIHQLRLANGRLGQLRMGGSEHQISAWVNRNSVLPIRTNPARAPARCTGQCVHVLLADTLAL